MSKVENCQEPEFFCGCCDCCCGPLHMGQYMPRSVDFLQNNYHAKINTGDCILCKACERTCPMDAISIPNRQKGKNTGVSSDEPPKSWINLEKCIGCGLCVSKCPKDAIKLEKNDKQVVPPQNRDELYDIIRENKRGTIRKYYRLFKASRGKEV